jgi:tetratricopeptide (TPR) repeat protein
MLVFTNPACAGGGGTTASAGAASRAQQTAVKASSSKDFYIRGLKEANDKKWADAEQYYTEALNLDPHYGEAYGNRGAARFNLKDFNGALSDYNAALKIFPTNKALFDLKVQVEGVLRENAAANQAAQNQASQQANFANQQRAQMMLGGDLSDPSTIIMMNAQRRGLITQPAVDYSDPASIIMMNARKRGLVPANTPTP